MDALELNRIISEDQEIKKINRKIREAAFGSVVLLILGFVAFIFCLNFFIQSFGITGPDLKGLTIVVGIMALVFAFIIALYLKVIVMPLDWSRMLREKEIKESLRQKEGEE